jgi:hypothetical protein
MRSEITTKPKIQQPSLTDTILKLCASGHYGVREAIATATRQDKKRKANSTSAPAESASP